MIISVISLEACLMVPINDLQTLLYFPLHCLSRVVGLTFLCFPKKCVGVSGVSEYVSSIYILSSTCVHAFIAYYYYKRNFLKFCT